MFCLCYHANVGKRECGALGEVYLTAFLCAMLGGEAEVPYSYSIAEGRREIRVDCETPTQVIEVGMDGKRSSFDSVVQASVAAHLTGKAPMIVIIDTNGVEDGEEWQIETAARASGIAYRTYTKDELIVWGATAPFRERAAATGAPGS